MSWLDDLFAGMMSGPTTGSTNPQLLNLASAGFPGAQQMTGGAVDPGILTEIGGALDPSSPFSGLLKLGATGAELPYAIEGENQFEKVMSLLKNPAAFQALVQKLYQPMNRQLKTATREQAEGEVSSAGLTQAPGAIASAVGKADAPFIQQNQQAAEAQAMQMLMALLGGSKEFGAPYMQLANMFGGPQGAKTA